MNLERNGRPRVVVTGMGALSPLGDVSGLWDGLIHGKSGIRRIDADWHKHVPVQIAGCVDFNDWGRWIPAKEVRRMPRVSLLALGASIMAAQDARFDVDTVNPERCAAVIGTTMGPHLLAEEMTSEYRRNGHKRPNPVSFANCLPNMPAYYVSKQFNLLGGQHTPIAACATGTQAIGDAVSLIHSQRADVVFAGSSEAIVMDYIIAGFASMSALASGHEEHPTAASRPFDATRNGFVLSEGAGVLILERLDHAIERGADIHAEVLGYASSSDAYHIAAIDPEAKGMERAMRWALQDAQILPQSVDYINAHGTGTTQNDPLETHAIKQVFGEYAYQTPISSNKSMIGHAMAASGTLEAIASIKSLQHKLIPPTINYNTPDPECDLDYVPNVAREVSRLNVVLSSNFGLGGQNASVVLGAFE